MKIDDPIKSFSNNTDLNSCNHLIKDNNSINFKKNKSKIEYKNHSQSHQDFDQYCLQKINTEMLDNKTNSKVNEEISFFMNLTTKFYVVLNRKKEFSNLN